MKNLTRKNRKVFKDLTLKTIMRKEKVMQEKIFYKEKCPYCQEEIKGVSEKQMKNNLSIHKVTKHPEKIREKK